MDQGTKPRVAIRYPALYEDADNSSNTSQQNYLNTIRLEFGLLIVIAVLSATQAIWNTPNFVIFIPLMLLLGLLGLKFFNKFNQDWYKSRALAESVKTVTWKYAMRADPFDLTDAEARDEFIGHLERILRENKPISKSKKEASDNSSQCPEELHVLRALDFHERKEYYQTARIEDQRKWYASKARFNRKKYTFWFGLSIAFYLLVAISLFSNEFGLGWFRFAFDPLIVVCTSIIGWVQIKKFSELDASYSLTAHEVGLVAAKAKNITSEEQFSEFVEEAELAFSREHTQWVARI